MSSLPVFRMEKTKWNLEGDEMRRAKYSILNQVMEHNSNVNHGSGFFGRVVIVMFVPFLVVVFPLSALKLKWIESSMSSFKNNECWIVIELSTDHGPFWARGSKTWNKDNFSIDNSRISQDKRINLYMFVISIKIRVDWYTYDYFWLVGITSSIWHLLSKKCQNLINFLLSKTNEVFLVIIRIDCNKESPT